MALAELPPPVPDVESDIVRQWLKKVRDFLISVGGNPSGIEFTTLDFTASNLTSLLTRNHNDTQNKQGGTTDEYYHITAAQNTVVGNTSGTNTGDQTNLTSLSTRNHNDLQNIQGGASADYYHLTSAQRTALLTLLGITGISTVITTAKLTGGGANGSMTFTNGILTASTPAT